MVRYGHRKGKMAKHTCCVSDTWFISLDEKEIEDTLGLRMNQYYSVEAVYHTLCLVIIKLFFHAQLN